MEKLDKSTGGCDYNYILHTAPLKENINYYHWYLEILPRTKHASGFERGSGFYVNPVAPEICSDYLRNI